MPSVAEAIGKCLSIEHKDKAYELAPVDHVAVIADYQDHLRLRSLQEVDAARRLMGPMAGELAMKAHVEIGTAGQFDFGSELWLDSIKTPVNQKAILYVSLKAKDRSVTKALADEIYRSQPEQVIRLVYGDSSGPDEGNDSAVPA